MLGSGIGAKGRNAKKRLVGRRFNALISFDKKFEIRPGMLAGGTGFRGFRPFKNVAAIAALPFDVVALALKYPAGLQVVGQFFVAGLVGEFGHRDADKAFGNIVEALFFGDGGKRCCCLNS